MKWILLFGALLIAFISFRQRPVKVNGNVIRQATVTVVPTQGAGYAEPVKDFKQRATKKLFGTEVTPQDSPVQPERFKGFHTGVDVEYGDVSSPVVVMAIDSGQVVFSRWVSGYGGVIVIKTPDFLSLYGHVVSQVKVGEMISKGQQIAILGKGNSAETDGERKHLHLGIIKGDRITLSGYVQNKSDLTKWIDPLSLY